MGLRMARASGRPAVPVMESPSPYLGVAQRILRPGAPRQVLVAGAATASLYGMAVVNKRRGRKERKMSSRQPTLTSMAESRMDRGDGQIDIANCASNPSLSPSIQDFMTQVPRDLLGVFIIGACGLPALHVLPVFLDMKMAADPSLPGLNEGTLPIASTAFFVGWLASAGVLDRLLEVFSKKQLIVLHVVVLLLMTLATITLPHLTAGNLVVFTCIRFICGLQLNITALQCMYIQEALPASLGNQVLVANSILYCLFTVAMAWSCSGLTLMMDWRLETLMWYATPLVLGLLLAFPDWREVVQSLPVAVGQKLQQFRRDGGEGECRSGERTPTTPTTFEENRNIVAMAIAFMACGCSFYGLTYSAGQLSPDPFLSCMLLHGGDIVGYLLALSADKYGRNNVQASAFFMASICLLLCSTGEPGSPLVLGAATIGRLCVDVCFTTIYVGLAQIFSSQSSKMALTVCETTARLGGIVAPLSGTWPTSVSCPLFASLCLAAACCTMTLPEGKAIENESDGDNQPLPFPDCTEKQLQLTRI